MRRHTQIALSGVALTTLFFGVLQAGPLTPPPGPVTSTGPTQIFALPFTISQSGSYILTSNLTGVAGQSGITVDADDMTIDLGGFTLLGVPGSLDGITPADRHRNLTVVNGVVADWGGAGVTTLKIVGIMFFPIDASRFDGLLVSGNGTFGIRTTSESVITNCIARANVGTGIARSIGSGVIENCVSSGNGGDGIFIPGGGVVRGCSALNNTGVGINVSIGESTIVDCTANRNISDGINCGLATTVVNCTTVSNTGSGIIIGIGGNVRFCTANNNTVDGINCDEDTTVFGNTANGNAGIGINTIGVNCRVDSNVVIGNTGGGILVFALGIVVRNKYDNGIVTNGFVTVGPTNDLTNPWTNFGPIL